MPTFDFTSPDGKTYSFEAPKGTTRQQAFEVLQRNLQASGGGQGEGEQAPAPAEAGRKQQLARQQQLARAPAKGKQPEPAQPTGSPSSSTEPAFAAALGPYSDETINKEIADLEAAERGEKPKQKGTLEVDIAGTGGVPKEQEAAAAEDDDLAKTRAELEAHMGVELPAVGAKPESWTDVGKQQEVGQPAGFDLSSIGTAGATGAALGAASPEILTGLGLGATAAAPWAGPAAPAMLAVGRGLTAAGTVARTMRIAEAAAGAASGVMSSAAGQTVRAMGGSEGEQTVAEIGAGALAGLVKTPLRATWNAMRKIAGQEVGPMAVKKAQSAIAEATKAGVPQRDLYLMLNQGAKAELQAAEEFGRRAMSRAYSAAGTVAKTDEGGAQRIIDAAGVEGARVRSEALQRVRQLNEASQGKIATAQRVEALASEELKQVGDGTRQISDIGNEIRRNVTLEQQQLIGQRDAAYKSLLQQRDAAVAQQERAGVFIDQMPAIKKLKQDIAQKLLLTRGGRAAAEGKAEVTEPGVASAYNKIYDAVINRKLQVGTDAAGNPQYQTFKTTFGAIDHVRRKLGDAVSGKQAEGYEALGQGIARDMYKKLSEAQEQYAGPVQRELQKGYQEASAGLQKYAGPVGAKATAVSRLDPEAFAKDPASLPTAYFKTQQSVQDLIELTGGNKFAVERLAQDYTAKSIAGHDAAGVAKWANKQSDWLREFPELQQSVANYGKKLEQIERVSGGLMQRGEGLTKRAQEIVTNTSKQQAEQARRIMSSDDPSTAIHSLLLKGSPEDLKQVARHVAATPGGKKALEGSVRRELAALPVGAADKPGTIGQVWNERLKPLLQFGGVMQKAELERLDKQVQNVLTKYEGKKARTMVQRLVNAAMATGGGGLVSSKMRKILPEEAREEATMQTPEVVQKAAYSRMQKQAGLDSE